jgi:hypothetical protein
MTAMNPATSKRRIRELLNSRTKLSPRRSWLVNLNQSLRPGPCRKENGAGLARAVAVEILFKA